MAISSASSRRFDVVLFGATGFTGRIVAEYLAHQSSRGIRWALAGRSAARLAAVKQSLVRSAPELASSETLVADAQDPAALAKLAAQTRVICTTVGPYGQVGHALPAACAEQGTDYCDLAGEVAFIRASIDRNDARAKATGARIVHCCGFDAIPSDLGVFMLHEHFRTRHGRHLAQAISIFGPMQGSMSGGSAASTLHMYEEAARAPALQQLLADPYSLNPDRARERGPDGPDDWKVHFNEQLGKWTGPFFLADINTRVVRRSNALAGYPYGRDFTYREVMAFGRGPWARLLATIEQTSLIVSDRLMATRPGRALLRRLYPAAGEGHSLAQRQSGYFGVRILGQSDSTAGPPRTATAYIKGQGDPGYSETAKMLAESALCLALDREKLATPTGVLTPSVAMGAHLLHRLQAAGITFYIEES